MEKAVRGRGNFGQNQCALGFYTGQETQGPRTFNTLFMLGFLVSEPQH